MLTEVLTYVSAVVCPGVNVLIKKGKAFTLSYNLRKGKLG